MEKNKKQNKESKEKFFDLYNKIKARKINLFYIDDKDLKKVEIIMEEEIKIKENILEKLKKETKLYENNYCTDQN